VSLCVFIAPLHAENTFEEKAKKSRALKTDPMIRLIMVRLASFSNLKYVHKFPEKYKKAFLNGLDYLLAAQYENGGWLQFYPLKGYYSHYV
jgi:pectinesterase